MTVLLETRGLVAATVVRRYQRFFADVVLLEGARAGESVTVHTTNTGAMTSCWEPGDRALVERATNPARKLPWTWIACRRGRTWVGVETGVPNRVVAEAARRSLVPGLGPLHDVRTEVPYGRERSRVDVEARDARGRRVLVEVKNVTLRRGRLALFPDARSERAEKHLRELAAEARAGSVAVLAFFAHRAAVSAFDAPRATGASRARALAAAARAACACSLRVRMASTVLGDDGLAHLPARRARALDAARRVVLRHRRPGNLGRGSCRAARTRAVGEPVEGVALSRRERVRVDGIRPDSTARAMAHVGGLAVERARHVRVGDEREQRPWTGGLAWQRCTASSTARGRGMDALHRRRPSVLAGEGGAASTAHAAIVATPRHRRRARRRPRRTARSTDKARRAHQKVVGSSAPPGATTTEGGGLGGVLAAAADARRARLRGIVRRGPAR